MYSGNGQIVRRGFPANEPLRVRLTDAKGNPPSVPATIEWSATGGGSAYPSSWPTDANGIAETQFAGPGVIGRELSWVSSTVTATAIGLQSVQFSMVTFPTTSDGAPAWPRVRLTKPSPTAPVLDGQSGQTLLGGVQVQVAAQFGPQAGQGIPGVGIRIVGSDSPADPSASCVGAGGTALTDGTGVVDCDVSFGAATGEIPVFLRIGEQWSYTLLLRVTPGPPGLLSQVSGGGQFGARGSTLPSELVAEVSDGFGHILPGASVTWEAVSPGTVTFLTASNTADSLGRVRATVKLGNIPGQAQVRLRAGTAQTTFSLFVLSGVATMTIVDGNGQGAVVNQDFARALVVELRDQGGQPVQGVEVAFAVTSGSATLGNTGATSDTNGRASSTVKAGETVGPVVVRASLEGFSVTFSLTVNPPVSALIKVSGDAQSAIVNQNFANALVVEVRNQQGEVVPGAAVTFAVTSGSASVLSGTVVTGTDGRASTTVRAGSVAGAVAIQASCFTFTVTFNLTVSPPGPVVSRQNIRSAVSGDSGVTPGGIIAIYGQGIAPGIQGSVVANGGYLLGPLPTTLAGVEVSFGSVKAPIYHVNNLSGQEFVVVQAPFTLTPGLPTSVTIRVGSGSTTVEGVEVKSYQPGVFETQGPADQRWALLTKEDGSAVSTANPIRRGIDKRLRMYCAGLGQANPALATNGVGVPGQTILAQLALYVVTTDGSAAKVVSAEPMVGVVGVYVVTIDLPAALQPGSDKVLVLGVAGQSGPFTYNTASTVARIE